MHYLFSDPYSVTNGNLNEAIYSLKSSLDTPIRVLLYHEDSIFFDIPTSKERVLKFSERKLKDSFYIGEDDEGAMTGLSLPNSYIIGGNDGMGKTNLLKLLVYGICNYEESDIGLILADLKEDAFSRFKDDAHLILPLINTISDLENAIRLMKDEAKKRAKLLKDANSKSIYEYNKAYPDKKVGSIMLIIDNLQELKENISMIDDLLLSLDGYSLSNLRLSLILCTSIVNKEILTDLIREKIDMRIAFKLDDFRESKLLKYSIGADMLIVKGMCDVMLSPYDNGDILQTYYLDV